MRKGSKMRIPNSLLNIYLILALIGLIVGLFIYNYFKLREGLVDENAIRNYLSYISFKDTLPKIPNTIKIDNNYYSTYDLASIRYKLYDVFAKYSKDTDPSNNQLNITLTNAKKIINNITKNNYENCLKYQSYLDNVFLNYFIKLSIKTPDNLFEFMETKKNNAHIIELNSDKKIKFLRPYLSLLFQVNFNNLNISPELINIRAYTIYKIIFSEVNASNFVGAQGLQGLTGDKGDQGLVGPQGPQGLKGDKGDQGLVGPQGPQGYEGKQGLTGDQGLVGPAKSIRSEVPAGSVGSEVPAKSVGPAAAARSLASFY